MNEEIKAILKMVESGKISAEEGEKLISSLGKKKGIDTTHIITTKKWVRIEVYSKDEEEDKEDTKVKINVPLNLAKTMLRMNSIKNQISLNADDITIDFDEVIKLIEQDASGELVNIESGSTRVRIWIE